MNQRLLPDARQPRKDFSLGREQATGRLPTDPQPQSLRIRSPRRKILEIATLFSQSKNILGNDSRLSPGIEKGLLSLEASRQQLAHTPANYRASFAHAALAWNAFAIAEEFLRHRVHEESKNSPLSLLRKDALDLVQEFLLAAKSSSKELQIISLARQENRNIQEVKGHFEKMFRLAQTISEMSLE